MSSIFTKIINGDIPCYKVAESDHYLAFLDINPLKKGHTLVIPKVEVDKYFDLDDDILTGLTLFSKKVAYAIESCFPCNRVGLIVMGLEVPHAHIHLIPINQMSDMDFSNQKLQLTSNEMSDIAATLSEAII